MPFKRVVVTHFSKKGKQSLQTVAKGTNDFTDWVAHQNVSFAQKHGVSMRMSEHEVQEGKAFGYSHINPKAWNAIFKSQAAKKKLKKGK